MRRRPLFPRSVQLALSLSLVCEASVASDEEPPKQAPEEPPWTSDLSLELSGRYFRPSLYGSMLITKGGKPGSGDRINVREDLNIDADNAPQAGLDLSLRDHRLSFAYLPMRFEGTDTLSEPFVFHGTTYPAGQRVESELDFTYYTFRYDYRLLHGEVGDLRIGLQAYYWIFDSRIQGTGPGGTLDEHRGFSSWYPAGSIAGELRAGIFHADASFAFGALSAERAIVDTEGSVGVLLWNRLSLDLGYRWMHFDINETTNDGDLTAHGPFAQLSLIF
jgi:hypothetical protein